MCGKGFGSFLCGGLVGAALGLLFAPKTGADTREFLKEKAQAYMDNVDVVSDDVKDRAVELYSSASDYTGNATAQLKDKIDAARGKLSDTAGGASSYVHDAADTVKSALHKAPVADGAPPVAEAAPAPDAPTASQAPQA
jgi:gas vesicle protein